MGSCGWYPMNRDEILAWVEAHRDSLPSNLDELARFPIPFRKVIATVVPHERRLAERCRGELQTDREPGPVEAARD